MTRRRALCCWREVRGEARSDESAASCGLCVRFEVIPRDFRDGREREREGVAASLAYGF